MSQNPYDVAKERGMDTRDKFPIFVTANLAPEVVEDFLNVVLKDYEQQREGVDVPALMMTPSFEDLMKPCSMDEIRPFLNKGSPFLGWTPIEIHEFFCMNCKPIAVKPADAELSKIDLFPQGTFAILDNQSGDDDSSPYHRTVLLCSNLPDFNERNIVYLKTTRVTFEDLMSEVTCLETLIRCLSEIGKQTVLSEGIPSLFNGGIAGRRQRMSFGVENKEPWKEDHLRRQPGNKAFESFRVTPEN